MGELSIEEKLACGLIIAILVYLYLKPKKRRTLKDDFLELAQELAPSDEFIQAGRETAHEIFENLKQKSKIRIDRTRNTGSFGKGTGITFTNPNGEIENQDFDIVIYVNDVDPPYYDILEEWSTILEENPNIENIHTSRYSVQFDYYHSGEGIIKFDLLPAKNFVQTHYVPYGESIDELQAKNVLKDISWKQKRNIKANKKVDHELNKLYSSSFSENTVEIIKSYVQEESGFTLDMVRLAKFWCKSIVIPEFVPGRSCMIELIAIYAQQKLNCGQVCRVAGFKRFLQAMTEFGKLCVCFNDRKTLPYSLPINNKNPFDRRGSNGNTNRKTFELLTSGDFSPCPIILDPSNPFNNFTFTIKKNTVRIIEEQARETLNLVNKYEKKEEYEKSLEEEVEEPILKIFRNKLRFETKPQSWNEWINDNPILIVLVCLLAYIVYQNS